MSLFSFLKTKTPSFTDKVWKTSPFAIKGMMTDALHLITQQNIPIVVAHFSDGRKRVTDFLSTHQVPYFLIESGRVSDALNETKTVLVAQAIFFQSSEGSELINRLSAKGPLHFLFYGHYPLPTKENKLIEKIRSTKPYSITFYSSLDDAAMEIFGGARITELMEKLGMKDDEPIEHAMVTKSMERARLKIEEKVTHEQLAESESEWFSKNVKKL